MKRKLRLNLRRFVSSLIGGTFRSTQRGSGGYELREIKEFWPEDDISAIHLLTSAKRGKFFLALREPERAARILFLMDLSHSGKFGHSKIAKEVLQASLLTMLGKVASEGTNQIGVIGFTNRIEKYWKPRIGFGKFSERINRARTFRDLGAGTDMRVLLDFVLALKTRPDLTILVSDFIAEINYKHLLAALQAKSDVICLLVFDPKERELKLPFGGYLAVKDLESKKFAIAGGLMAPLESDLKKLFEDLAIDWESFSTDDDKPNQFQKLVKLFENRKHRGVKMQ